MDNAGLQSGGDKATKRRFGDTPHEIFKEDNTPHHPTALQNRSATLRVVPNQPR